MTCMGETAATRGAVPSPVPNERLGERSGGASLWLAQGSGQGDPLPLHERDAGEQAAADYDRVPRWEPCRLRMRQEARGLETGSGEKTEGGRIPDIVITNYSMLEYMLCRPQDAVFFGPSLRAVVLDEAHLYTGTLAAEITLLLRGSTGGAALTRSRPVQIATSATLGSGDAAGLRHFAATLLSKEKSLVRVIEGRTSRTTLAAPIPPAGQPTAEAVAGVRWIDRPLMIADVVGDMKLAEDGDCAPPPAEPAPSGRRRRPPMKRCPARSPALHPAGVASHPPLGGGVVGPQAAAVAGVGQSLWGTRVRPRSRRPRPCCNWAHGRQQIGDYPLVPHRIPSFFLPSLRRPRGLPQRGLSRP